MHIAFAAMKYSMLSHGNDSAIVFDMERSLMLHGNTGPYLQYTHARLKSILRKLGSPAVGDIPRVAFDPLEHRLLVSALRLPEAIEDALEGFTPNVLANYLFGLASLANEFYHSHPVTQEPDEQKRTFRAALVSAIALTLSRGFNLLGIEAPEEM